MGHFRISNLLFFILGASLTLASLSGCGNTGNSNSTTSNSPSGNPNLNVSCGVAGNPSTNSASPSSIDVVTYHYDNLRTGQNTQETILTPLNVNSTKFGKLGEFAVVGKVDAQPLYLSNLPIPGVGMKNVLYVATEHGCVYAFDADSIGSTAAKPIWITSTKLPGELPSDDRGCGQVTPEIGVTSTPVIDRKRGAIYVVAVSKSGANYIHRIHALDLTSGAELFGGPTVITASYPGTGAGSSGGNVVFDPSEYNERAGLLELNGTIYSTWGSHCDIGLYTSWAMAYSADTLKQMGVLNLTPNGNDGGIWMSGAAPAADALGNIYFILGNGTFDTTLNASGFPSRGNCGNCFVKLSPSLPLMLLDYFTPSNTVMLSDSDLDLGSGGPLLLPDIMDGSGTTKHLAVASGKNNSNIYVLDRDNMGKFNVSGDSIYQEIAGELSSGGEFGKPSYFNNTVYYGAVGDTLKAFPITNGKLANIPAPLSPTNFGYPGTTPSISANGTANGIVWAVENAGTGVLHAYDATNVGKELYNSNQASNGRDHFSDNKFITPMVVNGRVYVGTPSSVAVFGLLP
jgi:hypothetical protein